MMNYSLLADLVIMIHCCFVLFVCIGGIAVWRWHWLAWLHLPAVVWGVGIELSAGVCPLTLLENSWRRQAGEAGYHESFIAHYIEPLLYPAGFTDRQQALLGMAALVINLLAYGLLLHWRRR